MKLGQLIKEKVSAQKGWQQIDVNAIHEDSRAIQPGDLFVAVPGLRVDGHDYIDAAVKAGAAAAVVKRPLSLDIPCLVVENPAQVLALATARLYGEPGKTLTLLGVTGTNGKTTTTYLCESILKAAGFSPGVIGTVTYRFAGKIEQAPYTTPTPKILQGVLAKMVDAGCSHAVLEVSSHALEQERVWGCPFSVAAFTHLTQDHLDLHKTMEAYLQAKLLLFKRHLIPGGSAVVNLDGDGAEAVVKQVKQRADVKLLTCSTQGGLADARLDEVRYSVQGLDAKLRIGEHESAIHSRLIGAFNGDNILLASAICFAAGVPFGRIAEAVSALQGVPGRLERVDDNGPFAVLVDYAHTPDALSRAIAVLRPLCQGRLIVVFGCGGDRDRTKRPLMGQAVVRGADLAVVTSDNPRTEDPLSIISMILEGIHAENALELKNLNAPRGYLVQPDRRRAIREAILGAKAKDIVLIAGKGHEDYQILGTERIHFDDREEAKSVLAER